MNDPTTIKEIVDEILTALDKGTHKFTEKWKKTPSYNMFTGIQYPKYTQERLDKKGYPDPRWLTKKQIKKLGGNIKKDEKHTLVIKYISKEDSKRNQDEAYIFPLYNVQQVNGLEKEIKFQWNAIQEAENLIKRCNPNIEYHNQAYPCFVPSENKIHMPLKANYQNENDYYQDLLHELSHWAGHESRLNRNIEPKRNTPEYKKEEITIEITSMLLGRELGLNLNQNEHYSYIGDYIKDFEEKDRDKILTTAVITAFDIKNYLISMENTQMQDTKEKSQSDNLSTDNQHKRSSTPLSQLAPDDTGSDRYATTPEKEFTETLVSMGAVIRPGQSPIMDGCNQRIAVEGDRRGEKSGFYVAYTDGRPAGYIKNHRTGQEMKWKYKGYIFTPEMKAELQKEATRKLAERRKEEADNQRNAAKEATDKIKTLDQVKKGTRTDYMRTKEVKPTTGVYRDNQNNTYIPAFNMDGKITTLQTIKNDGQKRFTKFGKKQGSFHPIGGMKRLESSNLGIIITEGYATAATVSEVANIGTTVAVVAAFDSGNLKNVAEELHKKYPDRQIYIAGDSDRHLEITTRPGKNTGKEKAEEAANAVNGKVILPIFTPIDLAEKLPSGEQKYEQVTREQYIEHQQTTMEMEYIAGTEKYTDDEKQPKLNKLAEKTLTPAQHRYLDKLKENTDFNDLKRSLGLEAVANQVSTVVENDLKRKLTEKKTLVRTQIKQQTQKRSAQIRR